MKIANEFLDLKNNFTGIYLHPLGIISLFTLLLFTIFLFVIFYLLGEIIRKHFFKNTENSPKSSLISLGLGYISLCTGLGLMGFFSLFDFIPLTLFFTIIIIVALSSLSFTNTLYYLKKLLGIFKIYSRKYIVLSLFICLIFLKLLPPETGADALDYHMSYPKLYLHFHTMMLPSHGNEISIPIPQLTDMPYVIAQFFNLKDAARFIHFGFFLLCIFLLVIKTKNTKYSFVPLLFVTTPIVLRIASSGYTDFPGIFLFLLSCFVLTKNVKVIKKDIILAGLLFGGMMAGKIWTIALLPGFIIYFFLIRKHNNFILSSVLFVTSSFAVSIFWYIRSLILTGNMLYNRQDVTENLKSTSILSPFYNIVDIRRRFSFSRIFDFSPLFFLGIIPTFIYSKIIIKLFTMDTVLLLFFSFLVLYIFLPSDFFDSRYLLSFYILSLFPISYGLYKACSKKIFNTLFYGIIIVLFLYSSLNTVLLLPYAFGWTKKDSYLTETALQNGEMYYDFNSKFSPYLSSDEIIAVYGLRQFYYADFINRSVYYYFKEGKVNSLETLKKNNLHKLLIRGITKEKFCNKFRILNCTTKLNLLSKDVSSHMYLYEIK